MLEARVRADLQDLCLPPANWVPQRRHGAEAVQDVVIVGGGMCGMVAWHALRSGGIRTMRILDRSPAGREGPWLTYARMVTLRSPKHLTGPAYGHAALTFRAWFRAQHTARRPGTGSTRSRGRCGWTTCPGIARFWRSRSRMASMSA
jgi:FAD-dependent urate hydroxylase